MGLFDFFTEDIAIDLGTANTLIIHNGKVVVDEPSIVATELRTGKVIAVGNKARQMQGKAHKGIETNRPLKDGVIADFNASEQMIKEFIKSIPSLQNRFWTPSLRMVICIPSGITEVEKRAVHQSAEISGAKEVYLIHEPMAAAIGMSIEVREPRGNMIIDIGGGTTEIAVLSLGGIVKDKSIKVAGDIFTSDIEYFMRKNHNLVIGERSAEKIKIHVGSALEDLRANDIEEPENWEVQGRDQTTGKPKAVSISYKEIARALDASIRQIEDAIMQALAMTPPELAADIYNNGIYLAGGGAMLRGLHARIKNKTDLPVYVGEDPLRAVVRGTDHVLRNIEEYDAVLMR